MPIHDLGYREWHGRLAAVVFRLLAITSVGIRLAWQSRWLRRMIFFAWLPALYMAVFFWGYEQFLANAKPAQALLDQWPDLPIHGGRHAVWSSWLWFFFRGPQTLLMVLVGAIVASPLIAEDVRTRAFLFYFARPITQIEYLVGKMAVFWFYLALITAAPALVLYAVAVLLSPDLSVVGATWDLPLRILGASIVLVIPTASIALAFSSMTSRSWIAAFSWIVLWAVGSVMYLTVYFRLGPDISQYWQLMSFYHVLGHVEGWVFGIEKAMVSKEVLPPTLLLAGLTLVSLAVLMRRISSPTRI